MDMTLSSGEMGRKENPLWEALLETATLKT